MIRPSTYYQLIYYQRIKLVVLVTFALLILTSFALILSSVNYLWSTYVTDVIVVGSGPFACHFQSLLEEAGLTSQLVLPSRQYQLGYMVDNSTPWSRSMKDEIIFPEPSSEELEHLAEQYDLPCDVVNASWKQLAKKANKYPQHELFFGYAENLGTQEREVYSWHLNTCKANYYNRVTSIEQNAKIAKVRIGDRYIYARIACLVEVSQQDLFEQYLNLDQPCGARVIQSYLSTVEGNGKIGSFFESDKTTFCYYRDGPSGVTLLSSDVTANFQAASSCYHLDLPETPLSENLELTDLPPCPFRVSHLFFPWRKVEKSPLILDTTNIMSTSPERDLLIVMQSLTNLICKTQ